MAGPDFDSRPPIQQQLGPGETVRLIEDWEQDSRGGVFFAGARGVLYGSGPVRIVRVSLSSIGDRNLRIETERLLTTLHRA